MENFFILVNENITPTYLIPGIFIREEKMKFPRVWYLGMMFSFTELNKFTSRESYICPWKRSETIVLRHSYRRSNSSAVNWGGLVVGADIAGAGEVGIESEPRDAPTQRTDLASAKQL